MKKIFVVIILVFFAVSLSSQELPALKMKSGNSLQLNDAGLPSTDLNFNDLTQVKKRKAVNMYFGAGYSFMIFTNGVMNTSFPLFDSRNGSFLTNINLFFGVAIAKAVTLEFEPSILFTSNTRQVDFALSQPRYGYNYGHTSSNGLIAIPIVINARFFPMFASKGFARLFFLGAGGGMAWIREDNDVYYNNSPNLIYSGGIYGGSDAFRSGETTAQWAPVARALIGFTGSGGMFGFGGEVRYNYVPLKQDLTLPFATRTAKDFSSVDISLRFYFSL